MSTDSGWNESSTSLNSSVGKGQEESAMGAAGWEKSSRHRLTRRTEVAEENVTAPAPPLEVGQRVMVGKKGEGTLLYVGELCNRSKHAASDVWYGVDLDEEKGKNDGSLEGQKYFYCLAKHGTFVLADGLKMVDMSDQETVMKALLKGNMVSREEVECLSSQELQLFFNRIELSFEVNQKKAVYVTMVVRHLEAL